MRALVTVIIVLVVLLGAAVAFIYSGIYNIAATEPHVGVVRWALDETMERSVRRQASELTAPPLSELPLEDGIRHYDDTCVQCHGAPGVEPREMAQGIRPAPPDLAKAAEQWSPAEVFWIVKHGIKMSAMPAFGPTHEDEELWAIVAFVQRLPEMSPEQYNSAVQNAADEQQSAATGEAAPDNQHQNNAGPQLVNWLSRTCSSRLTPPDTPTIHGGRSARGCGHRGAPHAGRLRRHGRLVAVEVALEPRHEALPAAEVSCPGEALDAARVVLHSLGGPPQHQRQAVMLLKARGMSLKEAAAESSVSVSARKVASHRPMCTLRTLSSGRS